MRKITSLLFCLFLHTLTVTPSASGQTAAALIYTRVDTVAPAYGQRIMILVPNGNSAHPYNPKTPTGLIMYFHGAGEDQAALLLDMLKSDCVMALLNAGYILAGSAAHGGGNWGNQASVDDYADLYQYTKSHFNISGVGFWAQSMGGLDGLLALTENKIPDVVGFLGTYPVCNLANLYALGDYTKTINTAYGITDTGTATYTNMTFGHDPALKWGWAFRRVPMRLYASSGDQYVPKAQNSDAVAALVAGSAPITVVPCKGNHGDPSHFVPSEYVAFFQQCFAHPPPTHS